MLAGTAALGSYAHYAMTRAFAAAPLAVTQPVTFLQIVWASLLGWAAFGEAVDATITRPSLPDFELDFSADDRHDFIAIAGSLTLSINVGGLLAMNYEYPDFNILMAGSYNAATATADQNPRLAPAPSSVAIPSTANSAAATACLPWPRAQLRPRAERYAAIRVPYRQGVR